MFRFASMGMFSPRRMSPPLMCALVAVVGGIVAGSSAVHGLEPNRYGPIEPPSLFGRAEASGLADMPDAGNEQMVAARCDECSERDLGYRWAVLAAVRQSVQCPSDSWAFRRGCLDYVGGI
ncbi:MAG: hypothetical protein V4618_00165 [Pseudomonadota bacterium]